MVVIEHGGTREAGIAAALSWAGPIALGLLSAALWLGEPRVEYLVVCAVATAAAAWGAFRLAGVRRWWAVATVIAVAIVIVLAARAQRVLVAIDDDWVTYRRGIEAQSVRILRDALVRAIAELEDRAQRALDAPADSTQAFRHLEMAGGTSERGVVLLQGDRPVAWSGRQRLLPVRSAGPVSVAASSFYLELQVSATRGARRAVASALVHAAPPADRLAPALAAAVARRTYIAGFAFTPPSSGTVATGATRIGARDVVLFDVRPIAPTPAQARLLFLQRVQAQAGLLLLAAMIAFLMAGWRDASLRARFAVLAVGLACVWVLPLNGYSARSRLFDPLLYHTPLGQRLTANAGALAITSALLLLGLLAVLRRRGAWRARGIAAVVVLLVAGAGPFLLRDLARGIYIPASGAGTALWLIWEIPLFLAACAVLLAGAMAGGILLGRRRGLPPGVAPAMAMLAALLGPVVWQAPHQWPWWYTVLWISAIAALALTRQGRGVLAGAATVAALGATTLVWANATRGRVAEARRDLTTLAAPDSGAVTLLERLAPVLRDDPPTTGQALLQQYVTSNLAAAGHPVLLISWVHGAGVVDEIATADVHVTDSTLAAAMARSRLAGAPVLQHVPGAPATLLILSAPGPGDTSAAIVVGPRSRLIAPDPIAQLLGVDVGTTDEPPYSLQLSRWSAPMPAAGGREQWRRIGNELHGDYPVRTGDGIARAHVEIELRPLDALIERGALIVLLDLAIVGVLWLLTVLADGGVGRWLRVRQRSWRRSYRARLTLALFAFFIVPGAAFATWSYRQLASDARRSRELLVGQTLRAVNPSDDGEDWLDRESRRLGAPLLEYVNGTLVAASDSLYTALAPLGRLVPPEVHRRLQLEGEVTTSRVETVAGKPTLFGFRTIEQSGASASREAARVSVLSAPALEGELDLERRRRDLAVLVLFATAVGGLAALWLSGVAARQLAQPISALRSAALAVARGEREPRLTTEPTAEFRPVFAAFRRMAHDNAESRHALEAAQRRTSAVLRNVASGVVATDGDARVSLANPRAEALLETSLPSGTSLHDAGEELAVRVAGFLASAREEEGFDLSLHGRQLQGRLTRLGQGGAVITLDDVTALARAQRVLAWGEMARQVAHEIKNPLTPIRLGVQHLRRAYADRRVDYDRVLETNVGRILEEIDRLDEIARAFSRYGTAPAEREPAEPTDVARVLHDVVGLESMGESGVEWHLHGADEPAMAMARAGELRDVLVNLLENARLANARRVEVTLDRRDDIVSITVRDDGDGIPFEALPRIFEPHFSTRTSGSGLGLAISRRLIDGWGGRISVESERERGTVVELELKKSSD